jgi:hypothetical protein
LVNFSSVSWEISTGSGATQYRVNIGNFELKKALKLRQCWKEKNSLLKIEIPQCENINFPMWTEYHVYSPKNRKKFSVEFAYNNKKIDSFCQLFRVPDTCHIILPQTPQESESFFFGENK